MSPRIKQRILFSSTDEADTARKFYRRCEEIFGPGCAVTVRTSTATTDAAPLVQRGEHLTQPST